MKEKWVKRGPANLKVLKLYEARLEVQACSRKTTVAFRSRYEGFCFEALTEQKLFWRLGGWLTKAKRRMV